MATLSTSEITEAFPHQASSFNLDADHPSRAEIQEAFRKLEDNALTIPCINTRCYQLGWAVLICSDEDWKIHCAEQITEQNRTTAIMALYAVDPAADAATAQYTTVLPTDPGIPARPEFKSPGHFI